jgi:hypothetical protein
MTLSFRDNDLGPIGISLYLIGIRDPCMISHEHKLVYPQTWFEVCSKI